MVTLLSIAGALIALSFLIFIHELGHYFMAKREGMRVEVFSIGFGSPVFSWMSNGVRWQIGWLPFGGYVKIAGTDSEKEGDLYQVKDGFFGKSPLSRIKVAFMGPFVNIIFALLAFSLLYISGGREKTFSEYTSKIGWIDPESRLYQEGVRPGDEIWTIDGKPYRGVQDLLYAALTTSGKAAIKGAKVDYHKGTKTPFEIDVEPYSPSFAQDRAIKTFGVLSPASYMIYDRLPGGGDNPLPEGSPLVGSGLQYGDRVLWVDGHLVYSLHELSHLLNDSRALLTVERNGARLLVRVPRVPVEDLKLDTEVKEELTDWQFAAKLNTVKFPKLLYLPYNLTNAGVVEGPLALIDKEKEKKVFEEHPLSALENALLPGDRIIAVDGGRVTHSSDILKRLQERTLHIIVERPQEKVAMPSYRDADSAFDRTVALPELEKIAMTIGTEAPLGLSGSFILLKPIALKTHRDIYSASPGYEKMQRDVQEEKNRIARIEDPEKRGVLLRDLEARQNRFELGVPVRDLKVLYNPVPTDQFASVFNEVSRTLKALLTGNLNPKWMSGPVGIVALFQEQTRSGIQDALYWLGVISLNLGMLNLLPIPMLDGGTIVLSLFEWATGKKISPKTMERLILPFAILLIAFFVFLTFHDLNRLFGGYLKW